MAYKNIYYDRDTQQIHLWAEEGYKIVDFEEYVYIKNKNGAFKNIHGVEVDKIPKKAYLQNFKDITAFEKDVRPEIRFLVDNYYQTVESPKYYNILGLDIETEKHKDKGYASPKEATNKILSIACTFRKVKDKVKEDNKIVYLYDPQNKYTNKHGYDFVKKYNSEIRMLKEFISDYHSFKPDIVIGWNSEYYDIPYLYNRFNIMLGKNGGDYLSPIARTFYKEDIGVVNIHGISHIDYMLLYKNYTYGELPSYSLDYVANHELGIGKVEYKGTLQQLYENDIDDFIKYNIRDTDIMFELDDKLRFIELNMRIAHGRHITYEDALHSTRVHEGSFLSKCKELGLVGINKPKTEDAEFGDNKIVGAYVKPSKKGLFDWAFDLDLTSLYPSIIITLNISPETKVGRIKNYMSVWEQKGKTLFKINHAIFDPKSINIDKDKVINIQVEYEPENTLYNITTLGDLYSFMKMYNLTLSGNGIFYSKDEVGILPKIMIETFEKRKYYKNLMQKAYSEGDDEAGDIYNLWQMAYKIDLNSLYGALLNKYFRLFDQENGQSITMTGRYIAQTGIDQVIRVHKELYKNLENKKQIPQEIKDLFKDPHLTGDTDSVILTAIPYLYTLYGEDYKNQDDETLVEDVLGFSKFLAEVVNDRMKVFGEKWLNSDNNWLNYKEEWIARRGFYMGVKKKYANYIIFKEGVKKEYLDIKGLDVIRSTFPKVMQDFMRQFLNTILKEDDVEDKVKANIIEFKKELHDKGKENINLISAISSVKTLENYEIFEFGSYTKKAPYYVKGTLNYNEILRRFDLYKDYGTIRQGEKVKTVYLKKNSLGISELSLPLDGLIPDVINNFVEKHVDITACISGVLDKKIEKFYDVLEWEKFNERYNIDRLYE